MVDVQAEARPLDVERLGAINVRDGHHNELELPVHGSLHTEGISILSPAGPPSTCDDTLAVDMVAVSCAVTCQS